MINKTNSLLIGVGEAGGRIVSEIMNKDKRYIGLFINTSYQDTKKLSNAKHIYVVPGADGTGRKREVAMSYLKDNSNAIFDKINEFPLQENLFFAFSFSGGTGSGMTPTLINMLNALSQKTGFKKNINIIGVLPHLDESKKAKQNAIDCWNQIVRLPNVNMSFILDNNKRETYDEINVEFANMFDAMMSISRADSKDSNARVIDQADAETLMSAKGSASIYMLPKDCDSAKVGIAKAMENSIFAEYEDDVCDYLAISLTPDNNIKRSDIVKAFKPKEDKFIDGSNSKYNIVVATGYNLGLQKGAVELLDMSIKESMVDNELDELNVDDLTIETDNKPKKPSINQESTHQNNIKLDIQDIDDVINDDLWDEFLDL